MQLPLPNPLSRARAVLGTLLTALLTLTTLLTAAPPSHADSTICEQFGSTTIQGRYVVQNNRWGTNATQCVTATDSGFRIAQADGSVPTNGGPKSYPSVFNGCHYTNCSPGTNLPARLSSISSAPTNISYNYVSGAVYDAAYDIWLDPTPRTDGVNRTEIMIWFNRVGPVQPVGSQTGTTSVAGRSWQVWAGNNGTNDVLTFVAPSAISSWNFDVMDFVRQTVSRGLAQDNWYLTSVQAGFEPWQNGAGLAVTSFSSTVNLGGGNPGNPGDPGGSTACKVAYGTNVWQGGFTADVTVTNTGPSPVNGWNLAFTLPSGQKTTSVWNANVSSSSGAVTASGQQYNGDIAPGGQVSFGFQGTYSGTFAKPAGFSLNGTACTTA
ncbi:cellulose binding domain-containing protein [Streptomyces sp. NBC_00201]|uniref:GH12 family glycosyl hydrolase domain-containing protein n=1 Tax=unclassified Streptomyces TaxID=2593676 RepID=UPI00224CE9ED|nr:MULTISPECIES: cellulose binding domain-containing protein [unclassified Streptomyces]MCX5052443.1 cellulose binding domain-containing protein [Streptomyces sp. NBC_00474]MCX5064227.1 cellulose binding domain-containing protein [Streptomyces sp. NBC_00452]MCX5251608.1 cellulose binding domain-containing protein [Streptomyces sp. NBC_00201]MCX5294467.1 cellulose binding domain-containing protein [Streptomyces sp. NBC_00183]